MRGREIEDTEKEVIHSFFYFPFIHLQVQPKGVEIVIMG
jgi:hypothetical protein